MIQVRVQRRQSVRPCVSSASIGVMALLSLAGAASAQDVTRPGDPTFGTSENYPGGEAPWKAIDNCIETKYLNFDGAGSGFDVQPSGSGIVRAIGIYTANDDAGRDPTSYVLIGSDDGVTGVVIASGQLFPPSDRFSFAQSSFSNDRAYNFYRVVFPTVRGSNLFQVAEVQLQEQSNVLALGAEVISTVYQPGASSPGAENPTKLFDGNGDTKCGVFAGNSGPLIFEFEPVAGSTVVNAISLVGGNDDWAWPGRTPSYFTISGSNDEVNFTQLFSSSLSPNTLGMQIQDFSFSNTDAYTRYRVEFGACDAYFMQMSEIQLFGTVNIQPPTNDTCAAAIAIAPGTTVGRNVYASGSSSSSCGSNDLADVWYSYTATASGLVEVNTFGTTRSFDATLAVFDGCGGASMGCNDNARGNQARVRWNALAGHTYKIRVAGNEGATSRFLLNLDTHPAIHSDVAASLMCNFNGMVQGDEAGNADAPNGYRSIADRGMILSSDPRSFGVGVEGSSGIAYSLVTTPNTLDIVHLGNRTTVDISGLWDFDTEIGHIDLNLGGDPNNPADYERNFIGVKPSWLGNVDQTGPQTSDLSSLSLAMGADTRIGLLYNASNGGTEFTATLAFTDGSFAAVRLQCPDWFENRSPDAPMGGVESQTQFGLFLGTGDADLAAPSNDLNVAEAVISTASLRSGGVGDFTGKTIQSITFSDKGNDQAGLAVYAVTIRDGAPGSTCPPCAADFNQDGGVDGSDIEAFFNAWQAGEACGDTNQDGGVDGSDIEAFFQVWQAGGC